MSDTPKFKPGGVVPKPGPVWVDARDYPLIDPAKFRTDPDEVEACVAHIARALGCSSKDALDRMTQIVDHFRGSENPTGP